MPPKKKPTGRATTSSASESKLHSTGRSSISKKSPAPAAPSPSSANEMDPEYIEKRRRNNDAVHRSREKKRRQEAEALQRVTEMRSENDELERKVEGLNQELQFLKDMFVQMASGKNKSDSSQTHSAASGTSQPSTSVSSTSRRR